MTCEQLAAMAAELTAEIDAIDASIASSYSQANSQYLALLPSDTYGGTYPPADPLTVSGVQARITYLSTLNPMPMMLIQAYYSILQILQYIANSLVPTRAQKVAQLGSVKQQQINQGCQV